MWLVSVIKMPALVASIIRITEWNWKRHWNGQTRSINRFRWTVKYEDAAIVEAANYHRFYYIQKYGANWQYGSQALRSVQSSRRRCKVEISFERLQLNISTDDNETQLTWHVSNCEHHQEPQTGRRPVFPFFVTSLLTDIPIDETNGDPRCDIKQHRADGILLRNELKQIPFCDHVGAIITN